MRQIVNTIDRTIEIGDQEIDVRITYDYSPGRAAKTYGAPENCYPADPAEVEVTDIRSLEPNRSVTLSDLSQVQIYELEDWIIENHEEDLGPEWDRYND